MKIYERIKAAMERSPWKGEDEIKTREDAIDMIIRAAYLQGKHDGVVEASKMAQKRFRAQREAARDCRYYRMASKIVKAGAEGINGGYERLYICHPDYSNDFADMFGSDRWIGDEEIAELS